MTAPYQRGSVEGSLGNHEKRIGILEAVAPPVSDGAVAYPVSHKMDGIWWRPWTAQSQGNEAFGDPVVDATAPGGYYITSVGNTQANAEKGIYIGFGPLGPRTHWAIDLILKTGPNSGKVLVEWGTTPVDEAATSISPVGYAPPGIGSDKSIADPWFMINGGVADNFSGWWKPDPSFGGIDLYAAVTTGWDYYPWYSGSLSANTFWVGGADGSMVATDGINPGPYAASITNTFMTGGGDQAWWCRIRSNGKNASSGGYGFEMAGFHLYRINGNGDPAAV